MKEMTLPKDLNSLCELSLAFGPSGLENEVADIIENKISTISDSFVRDKMGNIIALIKTGDLNSNERTKVMLSAHMDEVGVMITEICDDGLLRFDTVGGINVSVLEGRKMTLLGKGKKYKAMVMSKAIHHTERKDRKKANKIEKLYLDFGARTKEEAETCIDIGDVGVFNSEFYLFGENSEFVKGKALDDRMGCVALIETMKAIYDDRPSSDLDLYFCFTVREEIGLSGAKVAANKISPDLAFVLESTAIADLPDVAASKKVADVGKGGAISIADRSTIYDKEFIDFALNVGKENNIPVQVKRYVSGGNDAGSIHKSGSGVKTLALSVPTRYLHSASCVASVDDFRSVQRLVEKMIRSIDKENFQ